MPKLSDTKLKAVLPGDTPLADTEAPGLKLYPSGTKKGHGKWKLRFTSPETGKRRDMGLGSYPDVSLADARDIVTEARKLIAVGKDPINQKARQEQEAAATLAKSVTFETAARKRFEELAVGFKNEKHKQQWINTLSTYVFPKIGHINLQDLKVSDFADALKPIWLDKVETAQRVKQRCNEVMEWAYAHELIRANPVSVVGKVLPKQPPKSARVKHHPSLPWIQLPKFYDDRLSGLENSTQSLLAFVILTAARSGEARQAKWSEVDFNKKVWTVPARRMKTGILHRVPLSSVALDILRHQEKVTKGQLIFPAPKGGVLTDMALTSFLRKHKVPSDQPGKWATAHGFRSTFRNWASEKGYSDTLAERALAHSIKNRVEAAYHRTDLLEQRHEMMEKYALYATSF